MLKIYTIKEELRFCSELVILAKGLSYEVIKDVPHNLNINNQGRFHNVIEACEELIQYVNDVENSDIIVLPKKFNGISDNLYVKLNELSVLHNKPLYCFYNDDSDRKFDIPSNVHLYRTSFYKSSKKINEYALPAFSTDFNDGSLVDNTSIGYCGHIGNNRQLLLKKIHDSQQTTDFILRRGFWAPELPKEQARQEYIKNIKDNLFTFCYRGAGNFSYRFYETLMMGRIPLLIDSDGFYPYPLETDEDIHKHCLYLKPKDLDNFDELFKSYIQNNDLKQIQKNNYELWKKHFSAEGFIRTFISNL